MPDKRHVVHMNENWKSYFIIGQETKRGHGDAIGRVIQETLSILSFATCPSTSDFYDC